MSATTFSVSSGASIRWRLSVSLMSTPTTESELERTICEACAPLPPAMSISRAPGPSDETTHGTTISSEWSRLGSTFARARSSAAWAS
jgi:hypothetical protein